MKNLHRFKSLKAKVLLFSISTLLLNNLFLTLSFAASPVFDPNEPNQIAGVVFNDVNNDGVQDAGESGINGVSVRVSDSLSTILVSTDNVNGVDGSYSAFVADGLFDIDILSVDVSSAAGFSGSALNTHTGVPGDFSLTYDTNVQPKDQNGVIQLIPVGWLDTGLTCTANGSVKIDNVPVGTLDAADTPAQAGIGIEVKDVGGTIALVTTDDNGDFSIANLPLNTSMDFLINGTLPYGFYESVNNNSGLVCNFGVSSLVLEDMGIAQSTSIISGNIVYDGNENGSYQTPEDLLIGGVEIFLTDVNDSVLFDTVVTDANGHFVFKHVLPGTYSFSVNETKAMFTDFIFGNSNLYVVAPLQQQVVTVSGVSDTVNFTNRFYYWDLNNYADSALNPVRTGTLNGNVFYDGDGDGQYTGPIDILLSGVQVLLTNLSDNSTQTQNTVTSGYFTFSVNEGFYQLDVDQNDPALGPNAQPTSNNQQFPTVLGGKNTISPNIGFNWNLSAAGGFGSVSGNVYFDENQDKAFNGLDLLLPNISITLNQGGQVVAPQDTDTAGHYVFSNVPSELYTVDVDPNDSNLGAGVFPTNPLTVSQQVAILDQLNTNAANTSFFWPVDSANGFGTVTGGVFFDENNNATFDSLDLLLNGVSVNLTDANDSSIKYTAITNTSGVYTFTNIPEGYYVLQVDEAASNSVLLHDSNGSGNPTTANSPSTVLVLHNVTNNAKAIGYYWDLNNVVGSGNINGYVFFDANGNGIFEPPNDFLLNGVTVTLTKPDNSTVTTLTDPSGFYQFNGLALGFYQVDVVNPTLDPGLDPAAAVTTGANQTLVVTNGVTNQAQNIGFTWMPNAANGQGTIQGNVFFDGAPNGAFDGVLLQGLDFLLPGVTILLYDANSEKVLDTNGNHVMAVTDQFGHFSFSNIDEGFYMIFVDQSALGVGAVPTTGNDQQSFTVLANVQTNLSNIGFNWALDPANATGNIISNVFFDGNNDGLFSSANDLYLDNVKVDLLDLNGSPVLDDNLNPVFAFSDANGYYSFNFIPEGYYKIDVNEAQSPNIDINFVNSTNNSIQVVTFLGGLTNSASDTGYYWDLLLVSGSGSVQGNVFFDSESDPNDPNYGIFNGLDFLLSNVTVGLFDQNSNQILDASNNPITAKTDANGQYLFSGLSLGFYSVFVDNAKSFLDGAFGPNAFSTTGGASLFFVIPNSQTVNLQNIGFYWGSTPVVVPGVNPTPVVSGGGGGGGGGAAVIGTDDGFIGGPGDVDDEGNPVNQPDPDYIGGPGDIYFSDIDGNFAEIEIVKLAEDCKVDGFKNELGDLLHIFQPSKTITRADLAVILGKCLYGVLDTTTSPFPDVPSTHYAAPYIVKLKADGIIKGFEDGYYYPNMFASRAHVLAMALRAWKDASDVEAASISTACSDVVQGLWYDMYFNYALENGYITGDLNTDGTPKGVCRPDFNSTRAEAAKMIVKVKA